MCARLSLSLPNRCFTIGHLLRSAFCVQLCSPNTGGLTVRRARPADNWRRCTCANLPVAHDTPHTSNCCWTRLRPNGQRQCVPALTQRSHLALSNGLYHYYVGACSPGPVMLLVSLLRSFVCFAAQQKSCPTRTTTVISTLKCNQMSLHNTNNGNLIVSFRCASRQCFFATWLLFNLRVPFDGATLSAPHLGNTECSPICLLSAASY